MKLLHYPDNCPDRAGGWYYTEGECGMRPLYQADQIWERKDGEWHCVKHREWGRDVPPPDDREMTLRLLSARPLTYKSSIADYAFVTVEMVSVPQRELKRKNR